jgi:hypothetical protein
MQILLTKHSGNYAIHRAIRLYYRLVWVISSLRVYIKVTHVYYNHVLIFIIEKFHIYYIL